MLTADRTPPFRKLDFVTDTSGYISMLIYNSHPPAGYLIAPKYYPDPSGTWSSNATGQRYGRFEYYWNLKDATKAANSGTTRVYDVDKNPLHEYATNVVNRFNQHLTTDPCHGVPMYVLPAGDVKRYWDAKGKYQAILERPPPHLSKFTSLIKMLGDAFNENQLGITGSYLYELYQDFSDLNFVVYDDAVSELLDFLTVEGALLPSQEVEITYPAPSWPGWRPGGVDVLESLPARTDQTEGRAVVPVKNRFIGSLHDPADPRVRAGFWLANSTDPHAHGTFKKKARATAAITGHVANWVEDMPSGHLRLVDVNLLGIQPLHEDPETSASVHWDVSKASISAVQVIGEFNRMFLTGEDIVAYGLVEEIFFQGEAKPVYELLVGGREIGGWIFPLAGSSQ